MKKGKKLLIALGMVAAAVVYIIAFRYVEPTLYDKFIQTTDLVEMFKYV